MRLSRCSDGRMKRASAVWTSPSEKPFAATWPRKAKLGEAHRLILKFEPYLGGGETARLIHIIYISADAADALAAHSGRSFHGNHPAHSVPETGEGGKNSGHVLTSRVVK